MTMNSFFRRILLFTIAVALIGCDADTADKKKEITADSYVPLASFSSYESDSTSKEALSAVNMFKLRQLRPLLEAASDDDMLWQELDAEVRRLLREKSDSPYIASFREIAANRVLEVLLAAEPSPKRAEAIGHYTSMLVEVGHTDAAVLAPALEALQGHWSDARLASSVDDVLTATKSECTDCGSGPDLPDQKQQEKMEAAIAKSQARSETAVKTLRNLRDRLETPSK